MDLGGFSWSLLTILGALLLAGVIAFAALRNRSSRTKVEESEAATRRVYEEEERLHHGEKDSSP